MSSVLAARAVQYREWLRPEQCATTIDLIAEKFDKKPFRVQQEFHQMRHQLARDRKWYLRKRAEIEAQIEKQERKLLTA